MLLEHIRQERIPVGERIPSEPSLCRTFGVSRDTVRKAISGLVREGVLETRPGFGHVVCTARPTTTIALLWNFPIFSAKTSTAHLLLFNAIREHLQRRKWKVRMYLPPVHDHKLGLIDYDRLSRDITRDRFAGVLGAFWPSVQNMGATVVDKDRQVAEQLTQAKIPYVSLRTMEVPNSVGTDYHALGAMATRHFLDRGLRRIAMLVNDTFHPALAEGHRQAYRDAGLEPDADLHINTPRYSDRTGYDTFKQIWARAERPEALVIPDDLATRGAVLAAVEAGVRIPEELHIATMTTKGGDVFYPRPVVRLELDQDERAGAAIDMLQSLLDDRRLKLPPKLIQPRLIDESLEPVA